MRKVCKLNGLKGIPSKAPLCSLSGKLWPHGEFSYGTVRSRPDGRLDGREVEFKPPDQDWLHFQGTPEGALPLDLSNVPNSHSDSVVSSDQKKKPAKRGSSGITGYGRKMIKAGGVVVKQRYPHHRVTFCTITLPPLDSDLRRKAVQQWSEITRQLLQWLARTLGKQGLPQAVLSVTEIQPQRLAENGSGYLHFHLIWLNIPARHGSWAVDPNNLRSWFGSLIRRVVDISIDGHINVDVKPVKASVTAYMSKYMSKGSAQLQEAQEDWGEDCCPSTWWNMTAPVRSAVKRAMHAGRDVGEYLAHLLEGAWDSGDLSDYIWVRQVELQFDRDARGQPCGAAITVGWRGCFVDDVYRTVDRLLSELRSSGL